MAHKKETAVAISLLVTLLWSSSFVLVKVGLREIHPLMLVSVRYGVASLLLLAAAVRRRKGKVLQVSLSMADIVILGVTGYVLAQGLQIYGLYYLPAVSVTFILNFTPLMVLVLGVAVLGERPTRAQLAGMVLALVGVYLYFGDAAIPNDPLGVAITAVSGIGWACYMVYLRKKLSASAQDAFAVTALPMALGSIVLLVLAIGSGALSVPSVQGGAIILWLGVVNTAAAFVLWNAALHHLPAFEQSALQNTMLIQIAVLAWLFLGESLHMAQYAGIALVFAGVLVVQLGGSLRARMPQRVAARLRIG